MARRTRGGYRMTPKRRAALKKAQTASARKRRGLSKKAKVGIGAGVAILAGGVAFHASGRRVSVKRSDNVSRVTGGNLGNGLRNASISGFTVGYGRRRAIVSLGKPAVMGSKVGPSRMMKVDKDAIPFHSLKGSKSWPAVGAKQARKQNKRLRREGMLE